MVLKKKSDRFFKKNKYWIQCVQKSISYLAVKSRLALWEPGCLNAYLALMTNCVDYESDIISSLPIYDDCSPSSTSCSKRRRWYTLEILYLGNIFWRNSKDIMQINIFYAQTFPLSRKMALAYYQYCAPFFLELFALFIYFVDKYCFPLVLFYNIHYHLALLLDW